MSGKLDNKGKGGSLEDQARERRDRILGITQEEVGKGRALLGDDPKLFLETVPVEVMDIDQMLGGGWRRGRMGMVVGEASMGKTLLTQWTIQAFQRRGYLCGFIDPEKTYDEAWFKATGVNTEDLIVVRPESTEQAFELACTWAKERMDLIVIDSLAALVPQDRMDKDLDKQEFMGLSPRKTSEGLAKLTSTNVDSFILCTNQLRSKIGVVYGSPDEIPGGRAQKFYASYIVRVRRGGWITEGDRRTGYQLRLQTEKNKLAPPFMEARVPFMFSGVVDSVAGLVTLASDLKLLNVGKGGYYHWGDETIHGEAKFKQFLHDNPMEVERLRALVERGEIDGEDLSFGGDAQPTGDTVPRAGSAVSTGDDG